VWFTSQGFESSDSCAAWLDVLATRDYHVTQLLLTPTQASTPRPLCLNPLVNSPHACGPTIANHLRF
jgi:hypothetical protein